MAIARAQSIAIYAGEGANRWAAAHVDDVARLFRLALERHEAGARYHASAEEGVGLRDIANAIGAKLGVPTRSITRSEEHTSELQSLMRISYAVFCLKKKNIHFIQK